MPNGFDPVWMETVRIEIARDRLRSGAPSSRRRSRGGEGLADADADDGGNGVVPPSDFSIIVWNRVQEHEWTQRDKVRNLGLVLVHLVGALVVAWNIMYVVYWCLGVLFGKRLGKLWGERLASVVSNASNQFTIVAY